MIDIKDSAAKFWHSVSAMEDVLLEETESDVTRLEVIEQRARSLATAAATLRQAKLDAAEKESK